MYSYYVPFFNSNTSDMMPMNQNNNMMPMKQTNQTEFFDPFNGLMKGNMFPNEFLAYRNIANFPIRPANEREQLMNQVQAYGFALTDLNLYLDLNRNDRRALELYRRYLSEYKNAIKNYESKYGPLSLSSDVLGNAPFAWVEGPWPWERS